VRVILDALRGAARRAIARVRRRRAPKRAYRADGPHRVYLPCVKITTGEDGNFHAVPVSRDTPGAMAILIDFPRKQAPDEPTDEGLVEDTYGEGWKPVGSPSEHVTDEHEARSWTGDVVHRQTWTVQATMDVDWDAIEAAFGGNVTRPEGDAT
jgi:hypothetical protein